MRKVYVVSARRSAIGKFLGSLSATHVSDIGVPVVKAVLDDAKVAPEKVDELICGNVLSAGLGMGIARQISMKAGIPKEVCAYSINMLCGSGMKAVLTAVNEIQSGASDIVVAGGVESMSGAPYLLPKEARTGIKMGSIQLEDHMMKEALIDAFEGIHMGVTAENIAEKLNISREQQDSFAYVSQTRAIEAVDKGAFINEIVPLQVKIGREYFIFDKDEYPNRKTSPEKLSGLRPVFKDGGTVTAGNASGINDGASFTLIAGERAVEKYGLNPMAEIIATGQGGVEPSLMGLGPVVAVRNALERVNLSLNNVDLIELNEAFAAQSLGVIKELSKEHHISEEEIMKRTNLWGGAIALGHPVGASGNRILVTLLHGLKRTNRDIGMAALCIGGGMGTAMIVKRI